MREPDFPRHKAFHDNKMRPTAPHAVICNALQHNSLTERDPRLYSPHSANNEKRSPVAQLVE